MKKVFVGISGGVDSSASAAILKEQGYDVTGVFIKVWQPDFIECNWKDEMRDAMRVCAKLDIPFLLCDLEKEYKENVIDYMINEYKVGRTPNPDVMCNKEIKFKAFLNFALENGADYIATGHYAQNIEKDGNFYLTKSKDQEKDQTYFIWNMKQDILSKTLFPIGHLEKNEVRKVADKYNLFTAEKKDSQGLCFIGHVDMREFLKNFIDTQKGNVLNEKREIIGEHEGSILYTIGQRHGFDLEQKSNKEKIYYVISKDIENNTITVSENRFEENKDEIVLENYSLTRNKLKKNQEIDFRTRYRQKLQKGIIKNIDLEKIIIKPFEAQESITSGQSVVIYSGEECLGGGVIS